jgi:hypothetical protein
MMDREDKTPTGSCAAERPVNVAASEWQRLSWDSPS